MLKTLRDYWLRIDARSLAIFRVAFGLVLIGDLCRRFRWLKDFYSNEGVLPNHNHLFNLRDKEDVWSALHAFSSPGENAFAFAWTLFFYIGFLLGWHTRVFQVLALVMLVSLGERNILTENVGNYLAVALLAFTLFLPLGSRFSIDALRRSLRARDEKTAAELDDASPILAEGLVRRTPGWSPVSLAALGVLLQVALVLLCTALAQNGESWHDGNALYYALHTERWVSGIGVSLRGSVGLLRALTFFVRWSGLLVPALIFVPAARRHVRLVAVGLLVVHALVLGLLFDLGLYAWSLLAAAPLLVPTEAWEHWRRRAAADTTRSRTVIYDEDCGICLWLCRVLRRLDSAQRLTFQGNQSLETLRRRKANGKLEDAPMPGVVAPDLVASTVVVVDAEGRVSTRGRAVVETVRALPFGRVLAAVLGAPGFLQLLDVLYDFVAKRRMTLSQLFGMGSCGVPVGPAADAPDGSEVTPAARTARRATATVRELLVAVVLVAMLAQTGRQNPALHLEGVPQGKVLAAVAGWPRMLARWDLFAPEPSRRDAWMVVDAQTRGGKSVDPLTGDEPDFELSNRRGTGLGQLWGDYLTRVADPEYKDFEKAFKDYLVKGGPRWESAGENLITGLDAYWVTEDTAPPGGAPTPVDREKLFTHSRGGRGGLGERLPMLRPDVRKPPPARE